MVSQRFPRDLSMIVRVAFDSYVSVEAFLRVKVVIRVKPWFPSFRTICLRFEMHGKSASAVTYLEVTYLLLSLAMEIPYRSYIGHSYIHRNLRHGKIHRAQKNLSIIRMNERYGTSRAVQDQWRKELPSPSRCLWTGFHRWSNVGKIF